MGTNKQGKAAQPLPSPQAFDRAPFDKLCAIGMEPFQPLQAVGEAYVGATFGDLPKIGPKYPPELAKGHQ